MRSIYLKILIALRKIDWMILLFWVGILNVKTPVKIVTVILFLIGNRKLFLDRTIYRQRFTWFYISMIVIAVINLLLSIGSVSSPYLLSMSVGILFWLLCAGAAMLHTWFVQRTGTERLHTTVSFFFILNAVVTIGQLLYIILDAGSINPYTYQGMHQKYFISTGDLARGISFDVSTTNAVLNSFAVVYFLQRNKMGRALLCMAVMLLTASNVTNILLVLVLVFLFLFKSTRDQKSIIVACFFLLAIFMIRVSPQNNTYISEAFKNTVQEKKARSTREEKMLALMERPDSLLNPEERKQKIAKGYIDSLNTVRIAGEILRDTLSNTGDGTAAAIMPLEKLEIPKPSIHSEPFQRKRDTAAYQRQLLFYARKNLPDFDTSLRHIEARKLPGKWVAFQQTVSYLKTHPLKMITGTGMGNFSSKLAFRTTGLNMAGSYPQQMVYTHPAFLQNHLHVYLDYFSKDIELHSLVNSPDSVYDQLVAEYGLLGLLAFVLFYLFYFIKHTRRLSYGIPLLLLLLGVFGLQYWFEQLSVVILFEFLLLLNIKETSGKDA